MNIKNCNTQYDVIVVGGGPTGSAAAIAAGRKGAKVLLLEQYNCLGGMWTNGYVNPLFDSENKGGLIKEIIDELKFQNVWGGFWDISFVYEYMKSILEKKCLDAGVEIFYDTKVIDAVKEGKKVSSVVASNIDGLTNYKGKIIIDCTGDASVADFAGAKWQIGGEDKMDCQAMTLMFLVGGLPEKYRKGIMLHDCMIAAYERQAENKTLIFDKPYMIPVPGSDFAVMQLTHMRGFYPLAACDRTKATIEGRKQALEAFELLKKYDEDFKYLYIIGTAPMLGIRESRRIVGEYFLSDEDVVNGTRFYDQVAVAQFGIDIHPSKSDKQVNKSIKPYGIPFRSFIPKGLEGLLVAGKTISGSHVAMASYRVTADCCAMGEATGLGAAYAAQNNLSVRDIPEKIAELLK